jgi:lipid II:glycine glycyltransferase (peptidoglycan interpeptide bridge formation enzyme)
MYNEHRKSKKHLKWFNVHKSDEIKKYGTLVIAEYENKAISGSVFLEDENNLVYWITASQRYSDNKHLRQLSGNATYLTHWNIIQYAKEKGIKTYNLGPCAYNDRVNKTLTQFKEHIGGEPHKYYCYYKDYNLIYRTIRKYYRDVYKNITNKYNIHK